MSPEGERFVLRFVGDADLSTARELRRQLEEMVARAPARLIVDLTEVTSIDSSCLSAMLDAAKALRPTGGALHLVVTDPAVRRIFQITLLDRLFSIHASLAAALQPREDAPLAVGRAAFGQDDQGGEDDR